MHYYLIGALISVLMSAAGECAQITSSFRQAFTYHADQKIVYVGVGTAPEHNVDISQCIPAFMERFLSLYPDRTYFINIDDAFTADKVSAILPLISKKLGVRDYESFLKQAIFVTVNLKYDDETRPTELLQNYLEKILNNGGIVCIGNFTGPQWAPHVNHIFNLLQRRFKQKIILMTGTLFVPKTPSDPEKNGYSCFWFNNNYSVYNDLIMRQRVDIHQRALNAMLQEGMITTTWYDKTLLACAESVRSTIGAFAQRHKGTMYETIFATPYREHKVSEIRDDILYKQIPCYTMVNGYRNPQAILTIKANEDETQFTLGKPDFPPFDLFNFSHDSIPEAMRRQAQEAAAPFNIHTLLSELQNNLSLLSLLH